MVAGAVTVFAWDSFGPAIAGTELYEIIPGFLANLLFAVVVSWLTWTSNEEIDREFDGGHPVPESSLGWARSDASSKVKQKRVARPAPRTSRSSEL